MSYNVWLSLMSPLPPSLRTWPMNQACDLSGNGTRDPLVWRPALNPHQSGLSCCSKILSLSLTFGLLIKMCLGVGFLASIIIGTLCFLDLYVYFLLQIREVFLHYFFRFPISCSFSFTSGTPMMRILDLLKLSQRLFILSSFIWILFFSFVLIICFLFPYIPNHCLILSFIHSTVVSL